MTSSDQLERALRRVLWTVRLYLPDMVVIGGWVPQLYRMYGGFLNWRSNLSRTGEVDVAIDRGLHATGRPLLAEVLEQEGFGAVVSGRGAVWANDPVTGEKLELFVAHHGPAHGIGELVQVRTQNGIAAISLTDLDVMQAHTRVLSVPVTVGASEPIVLPVRVPTLGAYVTTKAATFLKRRHDSERAKDVVYIHDVMAAGPEVDAAVERDIEAIRDAERADYLRYAANTLSLLDGQEPSTIVSEAADLLAERDGVSRVGAIQAVRGYAHDLRDLLDR